jgi:hypothetical protein
MKPIYFQERGGGKIAYSDKPKKKRKIKLPKSLFKFLFLSGLVLFLMLGIFSIGCSLGFPRIYLLLMVF